MDPKIGRECLRGPPWLLQSRPTRGWRGLAFPSMVVQGKPWQSQEKESGPSKSKGHSHGFLLSPKVGQDRSHDSGYRSGALGGSRYR